MGSRRGKVVITSLFNLSISKLNGRVEYPGVCGACVKKTSYELRRISNKHLRNISIILEVILNDMSLNFLAWLVDWAVSNVIDLAIRLGLTSRLNFCWGRFAAAVQLDIHAIDRLWFLVLLHFLQVKFKMTLSLSQIDWLAIRSDIPSFFCHGLLDSHDVDCLCLIVQGHQIKQSSHCERDLHLYWSK